MDDKLKEAIKTSGNNLHIRTAKLLKDYGWTVNLSPYYNDEITNKPREIDIIASKNFPINYGDNQKDTFKIVLFVECKFFKEEFAFRMFDNDKVKAFDACVTNDNVNRTEEFKTMLGNCHRYFRPGLVGKLYDLIKEDKRENGNTDKIFNAMTQAVKSLIFFKENGFSDFGGKIFYYPVVCYSFEDEKGCPSHEKGIYSVKEGLDLDNSQFGHYFLFDLNYSYQGYVLNFADSVKTKTILTQDFYVDFVQFCKFSEFLEQGIDNEAYSFKQHFEGELKKEMEKKFFNDKMRRNKN